MQCATKWTHLISHAMYWINPKEKFSIPTQQHHLNPIEVAEVTKTDKLGDTVFQRTPHDDKLAPSVEDTIFLQIMDREV